MILFISIFFPFVPSENNLKMYNVLIPNKNLQSWTKKWDTSNFRQHQLTRTSHHSVTSSYSWHFSLKLWTLEMSWKQFRNYSKCFENDYSSCLYTCYIRTYKYVYMKTVWLIYFRIFFMHFCSLHTFLMQFFLLFYPNK